MMRRRKFPRRPIRPGPGMRFPRSQPPIPPKLVQAHRLFELGEYQQAAALYIELADQARLRGVPQAPSLYLRGAAAALKAGSPDQALEVCKKGLGMLAERKKWLQLKKASLMAAESFKVEGQDKYAAGIQAWVEKQIPDEVKGSDLWQNAGPGTGSASGKLPSTCSQCGGPVNPAEIEWFDTNNPVCSYCGAILEESS